MDDRNKYVKPIDLKENRPVVNDDPLRTNEGFFQEETASELVDEDIQDDYEADDDAELKNIYGWVSIALSVISFFVFPFILAVAGIVVGFIARMREAPVLGNIAIVIGALSIVVRLFILPLI